MLVCTSLQTGNHASTPPLSFLQAGCPFCRPTSSVKALKGDSKNIHSKKFKTHKISYKSENKSSKVSVYTIQYKRTCSIVTV